MNAIIEPPQTALVAAPDSSVALIEVISRAASDPNTDVDKLERLMAMYERITAKKSEGDFNAAMQAAQADMPRIVKNKENSHTETRYADLEAVIKVVSPIYTKHGFALSFSTAESADKDKCRVTCRVSHSSGHSREYQADVPLDRQGAKNATQGFGSSISYGRRYLTLLIFNIATTDDDDGIDADRSALINQEQANTVADMLKKSGGDKDKFLAWVGCDHISNIPAKKYEAVIRQLEAAIKKKEAKK